MDRHPMTPTLWPGYPTPALGHPYESHPPPNAGQIPGDDDMVGKSLRYGRGDYVAQNTFSSLQPAFLCLYPGCDVRCPDDVLLDRHVKSHFSSAHGAAGNEVLARRQHVADGGNQDFVSPYQYAPPGLQSRFPNRNPTSPSLGNPIHGFSSRTSGPEVNGKFRCGHEGCSKSFTRPADLERHAKVHWNGPREFGCPAPGCERKGDRGFTRKDKLVDHWGYKHRGGLGDLTAWMV